MRVQWITHKGKKIFFVDYSNISSQSEMLTLLNESMEIAKKSSGKLLTCSDVSNAALGPDFMKEAKKFRNEISDRIDKSAIIGVSGLKGMLLKGYNASSGGQVKPFSSKEDALDYLIS